MKISGADGTAVRFYIRIARLCANNSFFKRMKASGHDTYGPSGRLNVKKFRFGAEIFISALLFPDNQYIIIV